MVKVIVRLVPMKNVAVNLRSREDYDVFLKLAELSGWRWIDGDLPTEWSCSGKECWGMFAAETCLDAGIVSELREYPYFRYSDPGFYGNNGIKVIGFGNFLEFQKITAWRLEEILRGWGEFVGDKVA